MSYSRSRKSFRPALDILGSRIVPSSFDAPAPLLPSEIEQPPIEMPSASNAGEDYGPLEMAPPSCTVDGSYDGAADDSMPMMSFASLG